MYSSVSYKKKIKQEFWMPDSKKEFIKQNKKHK